MRILLDTHVFLWLATEPERVGDGLAVLEHPRHDLLLSAASSWELAIKVAIGRLELPESPTTFVPSRMRAMGLDGVAIEHSHATAVAELPLLHRDPFDRMIVAQARLLGCTIATADAAIQAYDVDVLAIA